MDLLFRAAVSGSCGDTIGYSKLSPDSTLHCKLAERSSIFLPELNNSDREFDFSYIKLFGKLIAHFLHYNSNGTGESYCTPLMTFLQILYSCIYFYINRFLTSLSSDHFQLSYIFNLFPFYIFLNQFDFSYLNKCDYC